MSIRSFVLCSMPALLLFAAGCDAPRKAANEHGTLDVTIAAASEGLRDLVATGSISITGLDQVLQSKLALPSGAPRGSLTLSLPAGLYSVHWQPNLPNAEGTPPAAESSVSTVVVAAGGASSVVLRAVPIAAIAGAQRFAGTENGDVLLASR